VEEIPSNASCGHRRATSGSFDRALEGQNLVRPCAIFVTGPFVARFGLAAFVLKQQSAVFAEDCD
jgi:hypothetical protein